jgi:hypothetical protein
MIQDSVEVILRSDAETLPQGHLRNTTIMSFDIGQRGRGEVAVVVWEASGKVGAEAGVEVGAVRRGSGEGQGLILGRTGRGKGGRGPGHVLGSGKGESETGQ